MALTGTMKIEEIPGESQIGGHEGEIDFLDIEFSVKRTIEQARGSGRSAGRVLIEPLVLRRKVDIASTELMTACVRAKNLGEAVLSIRKDSGDEPLDYLVITMENVLISRVEVTGIDEDVRDGQIIYEEVEMVCDSTTILYTTQEDTHAAGGQTEYYYDHRSGMS